MLIHALLFDLDGTLADTDPVHLQAWLECLRPHGIKIDREYYRSRISGRLTSVVVRDFFPDLDDEGVQEFVKLKQIKFCDLASELTKLKGLDQLMAWSRRKGLSTGMVTNATRQHAHFVVKILGLDGLFDTEVLGEEILMGKPDPEPYRKALENLNISGEMALAFEDSTPGVRAAVGAGIRTVGIASSQSSDQLMGAGAAMVIEDFSSPRLWALLDNGK